MEFYSKFAKYFIYYPIFLFRDIKFYKYFKFYNCSPYFNDEELTQYRLIRLKKVISYSYQNIDFYRKRFDAVGISPDDIQTIDDIKKIPILEKKDLKDVFKNLKYRKMKYRRSTSGSSGNPLVFYKDGISMQVMDAVLYRNYAWFGVKIGEKQARFWGHPFDKYGRLKLHLVDRIINRVRLSPFQLSPSIYNLYLKRLERFRPAYIYGYAQSIYQFALYFYQKGIDLSHLNLKCVILTAEMSYPNQRNIIKEVLRCPVTEEYGSTEVGVIGFRCEFGSMHLMENLFVEEIESQTENTNEFIISELYGEYFPFIRYRIGDKGKLKKSKCPCGRNLELISELNGRQDDFLKCPDGRLIDAYCIEYIIDQMPQKNGTINKFRIVQKSIHLIKVSLVIEGDDNKISQFIDQEFSKNITNDIKIEFDFCSDIEKDKSGKQRCFVSEIG